MLDRTKYLATFTYEIVTGCLKIIDPLIGVICLLTKKNIFLQLFIGLKTILITTQLVGTTYLYTIRFTFEQSINTHYEVCYYNLENNTECREAWESLQNTYEECYNATSVPGSRHLYWSQQKQQQQIRLYQLIESLPARLNSIQIIIDSTTVNDTTTNVLLWWNDLSNELQEIYDEYLTNSNVVTSSELHQLILLLPESIKNISSLISITTTIDGGQTTTTTPTMMTTGHTDAVPTVIEELSNSIPSDALQPITESLLKDEVLISLTSQFFVSSTTQNTADPQSSFVHPLLPNISVSSTILTGDLITFKNSLISTAATELVQDSSPTVLGNKLTPLETIANSSLSADIIGDTTKITEASSFESSFITDPSLSAQERYFAQFAKVTSQKVRQQIPTRYTSNVRHWWTPFRHLLLDSVKEYRQMLVDRPSSPPEACKQDLYHMKYIATDLTVSIVIYSVNMITDIASFASMFQLVRSLNTMTDMEMENCRL
ncbi:unnamed protein product [Rotaria sp. Silwood1]|nr:unnamed protein product [Rotaria sp. Silwood1]